MEQLESLLTVGEIARRLDEKIHRVEYVIRSRQIPAVGWAGHARVFSPASLERIASELRRMEACLSRELVRPENIFFKIAIFIQSERCSPRNFQAPTSSASRRHRILRCFP